MKRCPICQKIYPENSSPLCVEDGAKLIDEPSGTASNSSVAVPAEKFLSPKTIGILAAVGMGLIFCIGLGVFVARHPGHRTAEAMATVTDIRMPNVRKTSTFRQVRYAYTVDGVSYEQSQSVSVYNLGGWSPGKKVAICYDPKNPKESNLKTSQCDSQTAVPTQPNDSDGETDEGGANK